MRSWSASIDKQLAAAVLAAALLAGCAGNDDALVAERLFVMATWVDVELPAAALREQPELIASIESELREFERDYYAWGDGELARLNDALSTSAEFAASDALATLLADAQTISRSTAGAFDPGVGALVELWGFNSGEPEPVPPAAAAIAATMQQFGSIMDLTIASDRVASTDPSQRFLLDLGGIAKGQAVDRIVAELGAAGIARALVNAGGDLRVLGERRDRRWRVGIQAPRADGLLGIIELEPGEAAFTSGDYERYYERDGQRQHHILDPRTGYPATHTQATTVIARDGTLADAAATALFVAGPTDWRAMAAALGIDKVLRVDADGAIEMTGPMRDRFQPAADSDSDIIAEARIAE